MPTFDIYWSPDGSELFVVAGGQGTWITHPKEADSVPERFAEDIDYMDFSDNGEYLFFSSGTDFHIWSTHPYRPLYRLSLPEYGGHLSPTFFSSAPDRVLLMGWTYFTDWEDATSRIWIYQVTNADLLFTMEHPRPILTHSLNADGRTLLYADSTNTVYVHDTLDSTTPVTIWESEWMQHIPQWRDVVFGWHGENILGDYEEWNREQDVWGYRAALWNPKTREEQHFEFEDITAMVETFCWAKDEIRLDINNATDEPRVQVWNPAQKQVYMEFDMEEHEPPALAISPDKSLLARLRNDTIILYDVLTGTSVREIKLEI